MYKMSQVYLILRDNYTSKFATLIRPHVGGISGSSHWALAARHSGAGRMCQRQLARIKPNIPKEQDARVASHVARRLWANMQEEQTWRAWEQDIEQGEQEAEKELQRNALKPADS